MMVVAAVALALCGWLVLANTKLGRELSDARRAFDEANSSNEILIASNKFLRQANGEQEAALKDLQPSSRGVRRASVPINRSLAELPCSPSVH